MAINIHPRIKTNRGSHGNVVYVTGYNKKCTSASGRKTRMSRIVYNRHATRHNSGCGPKSHRSPLTGRCQLNSRGGSYDRKYAKLSSAKLLSLIRSHNKPKSSSRTRSKSGTKRRSGTKKRRTTKRRATGVKLPLSAIY